MKRFVFTLLITVLVLVLPMMTYAQGTSRIYLNGDKLQDEWIPVVMNSSTYVPLSIVTDHLAIKGDIQLTGNQKVFKLHDSSIEVQLQESNGNYYIPAKFLSEQLKLKITRDMLTGSVYLFDRVAVKLNVLAHMR